MAAHQCCIHFKDGNGPLTQCSSISFEKVCSCCELWINLDRQQRLVAEKLKVLLDKVKDDSFAIGSFCYHRSCYSKFTNKTDLKRSQARCAKIMENRSMESEEDMNDKDLPSDPPPKKMLRSSMPSTSTSSKSSSVLPPVCIICNKVELFFTDTVSVHFQHFSLSL